MTTPSPAELQWRINHLAGQVPPPEPEPVPAAPPRKPLPCPPAPPMFPGLVRAYIEARATRELAASLGVPPPCVGRYVASIPSDPDELDRRIRQEAERSGIGRRSRT